MASNKYKLNKKIFFQITLLVLGILIIFFTYFYTDKQKIVKKTEVIEIEKTNEQLQNKSTFENIEYEGIDANGNRFIINSEYAEFENDMPNIIDMRNIDKRCNTFVGINGDLKNWAIFLPLLGELKDPSIETKDDRHWNRIKELV